MLGMAPEQWWNARDALSQPGCVFEELILRIGAHKAWQWIEMISQEILMTNCHSQRHSWDGCVVGPTRLAER